jgi:hypothetical protein
MAKTRYCPGPNSSALTFTVDNETHAVGHDRQITYCGISVDGACLYEQSGDTVDHAPCLNALMADLLLLHAAAAEGWDHDDLAHRRQQIAHAYLHAPSSATGTSGND